MSPDKLRIVFFAIVILCTTNAWCQSVTVPGASSEANNYLRQLLIDVNKEAEIAFPGGPQDLMHSLRFSKAWQISESELLREKLGHKNSISSDELSLELLEPMLTADDVGVVTQQIQSQILQLQETFAVFDMVGGLQGGELDAETRTVLRLEGISKLSK